MAGGPTFFSGVHGATFNGPVTNIAGNMQTGAQQSGLDLLRSTIARHANYDDDHGAGPTRCDEDTRVALLDEIVEWAENPGSTKPVLWLNGAAGVGKSSITISVSERCDKNGTFAGCFMFWRSDPERNSLERFVLTIAYYIADKIPEARDKIDRIIHRDPTILRKPAEVQWRKLVVEPIQSCAHVPPMLIAVDGLDECENRANPGRESDQPRLLHIIFQSYDTPFPLRFLIASRPEPQIANEFEDPNFEHLLEPPITVRDTPEAREDARRGIKRRWERIYQQRKHFLPPESRYLSEDVIAWILDNAGGQWIFIITIFRYLSQERGDPRQTLDDIGTSSETHAAALAPLDRLYITILMSVPRGSESSVKDVFVQLLLGEWASDWTTPTSLADWYDVKITDIRLALECLHSVLSIPKENEGQIKFHHKSFSDFLKDPIRSGKTDFHLTEKMAWARESRRCFEILRSDDIDSENFHIASHHWMNGCSLSIPDPLLVDDVKFFDFERWIRTWYVKQDPANGYFSHHRFLEWLSQQDSPPSQFDHARPIQYLFAITCYNGDILKRTPMSYLRLLLVTDHSDELDWDGFRSLYRRYLSQVRDAPRICENEPDVARQRLDASFLCDEDRAHRFYINIRNAKEQFTLACLSCLHQGGHATPSEHQAYTYAKCHWSDSLDDGTPTSHEILESIQCLPHKFHDHGSGGVCRWLKSFDPPPPGIDRMIFHWGLRYCSTSPSFQFSLWKFGGFMLPRRMAHLDDRSPDQFEDTIDDDETPQSEDSDSASE